MKQQAIQKERFIFYVGENSALCRNHAFSIFHFLIAYWVATPKGSSHPCVNTLWPWL